MKNQFLRFLTGTFILLLFVNCSNDTLDDISVEEVITIENVTYQNVQSIFASNCIACHSNPTQNGAPMSLVTYQNIKDAVQNRGLIDRISRIQGEGGMMPAGGTRLPPATIALIVQWNEDGLLEN
ncbi:MAG: mono/diheme cytochrome c family protein [Flavobacteriaceae bacterium]|jgi:mono/diheme cytochrome c family protein|uniref:c-type cytochrome n=1 Tax=Candidatus Marifrigoribacter sp. Uisw_064 TaxID=3230970 RepID=UPI003AE0B388